MENLLIDIKNVIRTYYKKSIIKEPTIYLYSYGGSGTRTFYEFVKRYRKVNGQVQVHYDLVDKIYPQDRVIYLYGNPMDAVRSFYRKNDQDGIFIKRHCEHLKVKEVKEKTLFEYIKKDKDGFQLQDHFNRFVRNNPYDYPILIVHFDKIWDYLPEVMKYLELEQHIDEFPIKKERKGRSIPISVEEEMKFREIYQDYMEELQNLPPVFVKQPHQNLSSCYKNSLSKTGSIF